MSKSREGFLKRGLKGVYDETLIHREVYNPNDFDVVFVRQTLQDEYIRRSGIPLGEARLVCKSRDWLHLPHGYYIGSAANGAPFFDLVINFGDTIGKGNKLPSLPVFDKNWSKE